MTCADGAGGASPRAARHGLPVRQAFAPSPARVSFAPPSPRPARSSCGASPSTPIIAGGCVQPARRRGRSARRRCSEAAGVDRGAASSIDEAVERLQRGSFASRVRPGRAATPPEALTGELETSSATASMRGRCRRFASSRTLCSTSSGRARGPAFEVRWLNLTGFCVRPGFGSALDDWRVSELRKVYAAGLAFPKDIQCQVEWLVLWQRVGAGFSAGQQRELAQRVTGSSASASASRRG